eukprot:1191351-Prorocentrum_minimum.AAC.5
MDVYVTKFVVKPPPDDVTSAGDSWQAGDLARDPRPHELRSSNSYRSPFTVAELAVAVRSSLALCERL